MKGPGLIKCCPGQSNYWIIQTKLLTALFKRNIETKEYKKFVKMQKWFLWLKFKKKDC